VNPFAAFRSCKLRFWLVRTRDGDAAPVPRMALSREVQSCLHDEELISS